MLIFDPTKKSRRDNSGILVRRRKVFLCFVSNCSGMKYKELGHQFNSKRQEGLTTSTQPSLKWKVNRYVCVIPASTWNHSATKASRPSFIGCACTFISTIFIYIINYKHLIQSVFAANENIWLIVVASHVLLRQTKFEACFFFPALPRQPCSLPVLPDCCNFEPQLYSCLCTSEQRKQFSFILNFLYLQETKIYKLQMKLRNELVVAFFLLMLLLWWNSSVKLMHL